jgi:multidrug efflux system membrane fusion protein
MSRAVLFGRLSALLVFAAVAGCQASAQTAGAAPPPPVVSVADVEVKPVRQWDDFTGRLEAVDTVALRPRVSGQIIATPFVEGARVRKGQVLFQIDPRPFQAEVDRLTAEVQRARARAQKASLDEGRAQRLVAQAWIAKSAAEQRTADARAAQADLGAAEAALRAAQLNLSFTRVTAPIDGRVSKALITRGNLVTPQDLLTTVVSDTPIYAAFTTDEQTYLKYAAGERGGNEPVYMGLMTEQGFPHVGRLRFLDNALDAKSGTIAGRAVFDNADGAFTPGLFARIRLVSNEAKPAAIVPEQALGTDLGKRYVLVLGADNRVQYRPVVVGRAVGEQRIVLSGLQAGDRVVVSGLQKVKPGDKVTPRPAAPPAQSAELKTVMAAG